MGAATSANATEVALRDEAKNNVLLNRLKSAISDLVWNRRYIDNATYAGTIEIKNISKNKDLTSAVNMLSLESQKNVETITNLKKIVKQLVTSAVDQPIGENM